MSVSEICPPATDMEEAVAQIWRHVLGRMEISVTSNFFDVGGNLFLLLQVLARARKLSPKPVAIVDLFRFSTVRDLARFLGQDGRSDKADGTGGSRSLLEADTQKRFSRREIRRGH
jgi:hypothetical protein